MILPPDQLVRYYSEKTANLRELLKDDIVWYWDVHHEQSFNELKSCISKPPVLSYSDVKLPVPVSTDSSQNGIGSVCIQNNKPIAYSSRALTDTERNYGEITMLYVCQRI